jgi:hypothetical protein
MHEGKKALKNKHNIFCNYIYIHTDITIFYDSLA